jgi:hypothetical protein
MAEDKLRHRSTSAGSSAMMPIRKLPRAESASA